jgi:N-acetylneuraminic acid mutarotase
VLRACLGLLLAAFAACAEPAEPARPGAWRDGPDMPGRRLEPAVAAAGAQLVVAGGFSTSAREGLEITREVIALDTLAGTWGALPELPVGWTHASLAASGGTLYLLGGLEGPTFVPRGEAYALDPGADAWRDLPPLPPGQERGAAAVVVAPPHVYLLGGSSAGTAALASVLDYNVAASTWTPLPDLPAPRSHAAAMRMGDGTLIVAGGLAHETGAPLAEVYALPFGGAAWEPRRPMPTARGGCAYGVALGRLICAGGEAGSSALRVVEAYDPIGDEWISLPEAPVARAGAQGAVIGQQLYIPGGAGALVFEPESSVLIFSLLDALPR